MRDCRTHREAAPGGPHAGEILATSGDALIDDYAAIVSFALSITCTTDFDLARRLVAYDGSGLGINSSPRKHIPRMFDRAVNSRAEDAEHLKSFVTELMALERASYEGVMRAIRRYVVASHRISDDVNLAYALFVMSIESLAQEFDDFVPIWDDYDSTKRHRIDEALGEASEVVVEKVHAAVLDNEHVALAQRFREFALSHVRASFFRDEAEKVVGAVSRPDLSEGLRQAYSIRSRHVHNLRDIPRLIVGLEGFHETVMVDGQPTLTFSGLARAARHVIMTFVARAQKVETEEFDWRKDLPGMLRMAMDPRYWIGNADDFGVTNAHKYLDAFIGQVVESRLQPTKPVSDIRRVLEKVEKLVPSLARPEQRLPMLAIYFVFNSGASPELRSTQYPTLIETYRADFMEPSIISLAAQMVTLQNPDWPLNAMEALQERYWRERHHSKSLKLGRMLEAAFMLRVAEQNRAAGNFDRAEQLVALAVEAFPQHQGLRSFESSLKLNNDGSIDWRTILLPAR